MQHPIRTFSIYIFLITFLCFPFALRAQSSGEHYHYVKAVKLGGDGGWDYLTFDATARRLYIAHATHVMVYDVDNETIVGDIPNTQGVHGIACASEFNHGFVSCGAANNVLMFDLKTLDTLKRITVGEKPDAIIYEPFSKCVIACNGKSKTASVIEAKTGKVKATIHLEGAPEFAVSDGKGNLYINLEDQNQVVHIDTKKFKVLQHWALDGGEGPTGLAMDARSHRLFIGCGENKLMVVMDTKSGKILSKLPIGDGVDAVVFDAIKNVAISSNRDGTASVIQETTPDKFRVLDTVMTQKGARTEALDPKTHDLYLVTADFGPPPPATADHPHPRPSMIPGTFRLLKYAY